MKNYLGLIFVFACSVLFAQTFSFDTVFNQSDLLKKITASPAKYRVQIIYTQINRTKNNQPVFTNYEYRVDSSNYFYCASLVKLPCSIMALEKLNELKLDKESIMFTDSAAVCQRTVKKDISAENGYPSITHYIRKMLLVSDNVAYGRVYEFLGINYMHKRLAELGYKNIRIVNRFDGACKGADNLITNPVSFYDSDLKLIYRQPQQTAKGAYPFPLKAAKVGKAYYNSNNKKINEPKDFSGMNYMSLQNIHSILQRLVFHNNLPAAQRYRITDADHKFLLHYLSLYPRESVYPAYDTKTYFDSYKKYFIYGDSKKPITDTNVRITNIVGQSYGFMIDCAYIHDASKQVEFMLSAVIYANEDEIINDGKYDYNTIALPYLTELGRQFYRYETKRKK